MLIEVAQILFQSASKPVNIMKKTLNGKIRTGNKEPQTTTGKTANSISAQTPEVVGSTLNWDFKSNDAAVRLNNGGSLKTKGSSGVAYSGKGGGGESAYIGALMIWIKNKFPEKTPAERKRMAFAVAASAENRGRTVKSYGWLDNAKAEIEKQINKDMAGAIAIAINQKINKALK